MIILLKNPIYLKLLLVFRCVMAEIYIWPLLDDIIGYIAIIWSALYLLYDLFHERKFIDHSYSFQSIAFWSLICISLAINGIRYGEMTIAFKNAVANTIMLLLLTTPSQNGEGRKDMYKMMNTLIISSFPINLLGTLLFFIRVKLDIVLFNIPSASILEQNGMKYNTYWIERFFTPYINANGAALTTGLGILAIIYCIKFKKHSTIVKIWFAVNLFCDFIVFIGCASRGASLGMASAISALIFLLYLRANIQKTKAQYKKWMIYVKTGVITIGTFLVALTGILVSIKIIPQISGITTGVYISAVENMQQAHKADVNLAESGVEKDSTVMQNKIKTQEILAPYAMEGIARNIAEVDGMNTRLNIWKVYIENIVHNPIWGIGVGHDNLVYDAYIERHFPDNQLVDPMIRRLSNEQFGTHNVYVDIIARYGIPSFILFCFYFWVLAKHAMNLVLHGEKNEVIYSEYMIPITMIVFVMVMGLTGSLLLGAYTLSNIFVWSSIAFFSEKASEKRNYNLNDYLVLK